MRISAGSLSDSVSERKGFSSRGGIVPPVLLGGGATSAGRIVANLRCSGIDILAEYSGYRQVLSC